VAVRPLLVVLRALGLGDLLTAVPALRALGRAHPEHDRVLAAPAPLAPLVPLVEPGLRLVPARELEPLPGALRRPEVAVNLHGRGPDSHRVLIETRPARRLWLEHADVPQSRGAPRWRPGEHEVRRWCRMLDEQGVPADPTDLELRPPPGEPPDRVRGATLIHPGAASAARRWPAERWARVARAERERGAAVVLTGGPGEADLARSIADRAGLDPDCDLAGQTDLLELARAVAAGGRVLCGDTGVAHLATALATPSVILFGPTSPAEWGPPLGCERHRVLWAGRRGNPHRAAPDPGLLEIGVSDVLEALSARPA